MLQKANVLLLDEPTNHCDIATQEALEFSLKQYEGTVIMVSHDRYFIDNVADRVWEIVEGQVVMPETTSIHDILDQPSPEQLQKARNVKQHQQRNALQKEIKRLEKAIMEAETQLEAYRELRYEPEYYHDFKQMQALDASIDEQHNTIAHLMEQWETAMEEYEQYEPRI